MKIFICKERGTPGGLDHRGGWGGPHLSEQVCKGRQNVGAPVSVWTRVALHAGGNDGSNKFRQGVQALHDRVEKAGVAQIV